MKNSLLESFNTPFETAPFNLFQEKEYLPAIKETIDLAKSNIDAIVQNTEDPTFDNTILALENAGKELDKVSSIFFNLNSAETNDEMQKIAKEISPLMSEFGNDILFNEPLFDKIKHVWDLKESLDLDVEDTKLLDETYQKFVRNGANLNDEGKIRKREISKRLSELSLTFGERVLAETNKYEMLLEDEQQLSGLPDSVKEMASMEAKAKGYEGKWLITLQYPSYIPFMTYADNRALREELFRAFGSKSFKGDELDNQENVKEIVALRHELAQLLGFETYADFVLQKRMAETPQRVLDFLNDLLVKAKPAALKDVEEVKNYAREKGLEGEMQRWDWAYYSEKLKQEKFSFDDEKLKPYFPLDHTVQGVFEVATKLYGISFEERKDIAVYHEDVKTYEVIDEKGNHVAVFYADFFPRAGKRGGAWMTSFRGQSHNKTGEQRPHVSIVCNFSKPTETKPSLLTFNEVTTLFHEFGHALHGMLAQGKYESLTGTSVYWDFVELPSQVLENWAYEKECLDLFAKHYETGETIPQELVTKIKEAATFLEGYQTVRQLSFGLLDMQYHHGDGVVNDVSSFEQKAMEPTQVLPHVEGTNMSCAFSHIFQGGYAAGYYSYKWAEVLDADAFEMFKEKGVFNKEVATSFKENILSKGGTEHPMELYKRFRGKEPQVDALLKRAGLIES